MPMEGKPCFRVSHTMPYYSKDKAVYLAAFLALNAN